MNQSQTIELGKVNKKRDIFGNITKFLLVLIPIVVGGVVMFKFAAPFGLKVTYDFNIAQNAELFGKIRDVDRTAFFSYDNDKFEIKDKFDITKELIEFSVEPISREFKTLKLTIGFGDFKNTSTLVQLLNFKTQVKENFLVQNFYLDKIGTPAFEYQGYTAWAFNEDINTLSKFAQKISELGQSSDTISTCVLGNSVYIQPQINAETYTAPRVYNQTLRGEHSLSVYVAADGILYFSMDKRDLNWYSGNDDVSVRITHEGELVRQDSILDDGIYDGKFGRPLGLPTQYLLELQGLEQGVYQIDIAANDDVILENLASKNSKMVVNKDVFLANNSIYGVKSIPSVIYTFAPRLFTTSYHDTGAQTVFINDQKFSLESVQNFESLELIKDKTNKVSYEASDVRISSKDYYAFSQEGYFKPTILDELNCLNFPSDVIVQQDLLFIKNVATKNADGTFTMEIPYSTDFIGPENRIYFYIYNPGLGSDENKIEIKSMKIEMIK